jgi:hypothetical protein
MASDPSNSPEAEEVAEPLSSNSASPETPQDPTFGWNVYAEKLNGRFAMVGFVALLVLELFTRQDFFTWLGF